MKDKKFNIGDRVRLESPWGPDDPNEGKEGIVVGYTEDTIVFKCSSAMGTNGADQNFA